MLLEKSSAKDNLEISTPVKKLIIPNESKNIVINSNLISFRNDTSGFPRDVYKTDIRQRRENKQMKIFLPFFLNEQNSTTEKSSVEASKAALPPTRNEAIKEKKAGFMTTKLNSIFETK